MGRKAGWGVRQAGWGVRQAGWGVPETSFAAAATRLTAYEAIGTWIAAEVTLRALGDPDAVSVGDFHLRNIVAFALAGEPRGTDERRHG